MNSRSICLIVKFLPLFLVLILSSCSSVENDTNIYKGLSLENVVTNYLTYNSIAVPGKDFSISLNESVDGCVVGSCGTVWVKLGNMNLPLAYQKISGRIFLDGIAINKDGSTLRKRFTPISSNRVHGQSSTDTVKKEDNRTKEPIDKSFIHEPADFNYLILNKDNELSVRIVCDIGIQYCSSLIDLAASLPHVNIEYFPFSMTDDTLFLNALVASSPLPLRYGVFRFLSHSFGLKNDILLSRLKKRLHVEISDSVLKMNKVRLQKLKIKLEKKGVKILPTSIFGDGSILVGMPKSSLSFRKKIEASLKSK